MVVRTSLSFGGKILDPHKFKIEHVPDFAIPIHELDRIHIDGRSGDIISDKGSFKNKPRKYKISFGANGPEDFSAHCSEIAAWLDCDNYKELSDTYDKDYYYYAIPIGDPVVKSILNGLAGEVELEFSCIPKRFLKYGNREFHFAKGNNQSSSDIFRLSNPTNNDSKPIIYFFPNNTNENYYITVKQTASQVTPSFRIEIDRLVHVMNEMIVIDCERENVYSQNSLQNLNAQTTLSNGFPILFAGANNCFDFGGGIDKITVLPRFWVF